MNRLRWTSVMALAGLALVVAAGAQTPPAEPAAPAARPGGPGSDWQPRTEAIIAQLQSARWSEAEGGARSVLGEMVEWIAGGEGAARTLALMIALQALGEAGLGRDDAAVWHWQLAQQMAPSISAMNMTPFGPAGAALLGRAPRGNCGEAALPSTAGVVKPRAVDRPRPVYPDGLRSAGVHGTVIVEAVVGADGVPREPRVLTPQAPPALVLAAAESLQRSRFTPARLGEEAVPFCFASSVRFELVEEARQ